MDRDLLLAPEFWATLIQFGGALILTGFALQAVRALIQRRSIHEARLLIANGVLTSLSFSVAATLLTTIHLQSWSQIIFFVAILAFRTIMKRIFTWERARLSLVPPQR